ncbi:hypothetical protein CRG49_009400 [Neisseria sp. N95_16]|nr:hypothetical protein CRG49_009400 [Neisseria sp. N95_16]PJO78012.1 hypothetical protein CWC45_07150 [Neisseria sp. N177_16]
MINQNLRPSECSDDLYRFQNHSQINRSKHIKLPYYQDFYAKFAYNSHQFRRQPSEPDLIAFKAAALPDPKSTVPIGNHHD